MGNFETGKEGVESWAMRITDESVCAAPERGRVALAALVKSWAGAPHCLKDALRARLREELERMVSWTSFCGAREPAAAAVRKSSSLLKGLTELRGPDLADRWLQTVRAPDTGFLSRPG